MGLQQLLEDLLGLDSYIQVNKTLIQRLGLHEAILLSELYSERSYWRKENKLIEEKWFYSTRENLEENTGLTPYYQRDALLNLSQLGIIECKLMNTPAKKYYSIVDDKLLKALTACDESLLQLDEKGFNDINNNKIKTINTNNKKESTGAGALSKKHPRNFSKERLTDDLESGKDIDEQKSATKKSNKFDSCLAEIDKRDFTDDEKALLRKHIDWSFHCSDPNRNSTAKRYAKHLDELLKLQGDKKKIIQQSIDKKWHCFYDIKNDSKQSYTSHSDRQIIGQTLTAEEAKQKLAEYAERNGVI